MRNLLIFAVFLFVQLALAANPLSNCAAGRGVPYTLAASGGTCNLPTIGIPVANVDQTFFDGGAKCGACYQVTGPSGIVVVQVVDSCASTTGTGTCSGDVTQFGLDETTAYDKIVSDRNTTDIIYDLGYREVTCDVTGNVAYIASSVSDYFFQIQIWNFRVALTDVRIKASSWSAYEQLTRQGSSGIWQWNKNSNNLAFPLTIYLVGMTEQVITATVKSSFASGQSDFGDQFSDVTASNGDCPMSSSPASVYTDAVGYGWIGLRDSFDYNTLDFNDTSSPYSGVNCIHTQLQQYGGLQFTRTGGFNPLYFSYLTFAAKASTSGLNVKVYLGDGTGLSVQQALTTDWAVYNISVSSLTTNDLEYALVFLNNNIGGAEDFYFDSITWEEAPASEQPGSNITQVTSTGYTFVDTTGTVVIVDSTTDTTGGFSFSDSEGTGSSSSGSSIISNILMYFASVMVVVTFF